MSHHVKGLAYAATASVAALLAMMATTPTPAFAQAANKNLTVVLEEEPDSLDGCNANRSNNGRVTRNNVFEGLTEIEPKDGSIKPRLAVSWERKDDLTWRFKLREGTTFHDGAPVNAENIAKSISRTIDTQLVCETRVKFFGGLKVTGKPVDTYTIDLVTDKPVPILPTYMGSLMLSSPNTPMDKVVQVPIGSGPYQFVSYNPGNEIVLKRNDKWWGAKPDVETVRYLWRGESAVRAAMVKVGEADLAPGIASQDAVDRDTDFSYPNSETSRLRIDTLVAPLDDKRMRLALNYAADVKSLRGTVFSKDVIPGNQMVVEGIAGFDPELDKKAIPYDPAKAKQLIAEAKAAGVPVEKEITMIGRNGIYPGSNEVMEAFLAWYKAVGLNVKLKMTDVAEWRGYHNQPFPADRGPNIVQSMHDNNSGDSVFTVYYLFSCKGSTSALCVPALDKKILDTQEMVGQARVDSWKKIANEIYDEVPQVYMYHMVGYSLLNKRIAFRPSVATNSEVQISQIKFK